MKWRISVFSVEGTFFCVFNGPIVCFVVLRCTCTSSLCIWHFDFCRIIENIDCFSNIPIFIVLIVVDHAMFESQ